MVRKLTKEGDLKGVRAWRVVAEEVERLEVLNALPNEWQIYPPAANVRRAG
jgi:hypothetical protein